MAVAAAVAALFSLHLEKTNSDGADILVPLTFTIIIGTVILQSITAKPLAQLLGLAQKKPNGVLFIGANRVSREMAKAIRGLGFDVLLADSNWEHIKQARMDGLSTFYGNPASEYAEIHLDTSNIGYLVASSPLKDLNALACSKFRSILGRNKLFYLNSSAEARASSKHQVSHEHKGETLIDENFTYSRFSSDVQSGAKLKTTTLSEEFTYDDLQKTQVGQIPFFAVDKRNNLLFFTTNTDISPKPGWKVTSLILQDEDEED